MAEERSWKSKILELSFYLLAVISNLAGDGMALSQKNPMLLVVHWRYVLLGNLLGLLLLALCRRRLSERLIHSVLLLVGDVIMLVGLSLPAVVLGTQTEFLF